jgi:cysteinyl-tRNA synthetase
MQYMLKLYNSLSRKIETFKPRNSPHVGMYTCGPTVYDFAHIGNFRSFTTADILLRALHFNKFDVNFVMNITDVGHMTEDQAGGGDSGEDKMEKTARKEGKSVWEVADFYTETFLNDYTALNLTPPTTLCKATDHIEEQIDLIRKLEENGYTYETSDGVYFDTARFEGYGAMSSLDVGHKSAPGFERVEINDEKRNPRDFALWKFSPEGEKRQMEWKSPWGVGFPGWHIECSAMSMKYLGESFDIHTGGIDHKEIHHPNEIAQSEGATGKQFVKYWVHTAFMHVSGEKMSKSLGNIYRLYDLEKQNYDALALRYLYLQTHYRQEMNFTFQALDSAQNAFKKLVLEISRWEGQKPDPEDLPSHGVREYEKRFFDAINEDLNTPQALGVMWELVKSELPKEIKLKAIFKFDEVLGLNLEELSSQVKKVKGIVPPHIREMIAERQRLRKMKKYNAADQLRAEIEKMGYAVEDSDKGPKVHKKATLIPNEISSKE